MDKFKLAEAFGSVLGEDNIKIDEPMKNHTSFKLGGPADILLTPRDTDHLRSVISICNSQDIPFFIMGNGTNLIVRDKGIRGVVIKIYENFCDYSLEGELLTAGAGLRLSRVANIALDNELAGLEFASGIPGSLGGAVAMNAGAYIGEMKDVVIKTEYMDALGNLIVIEGEDHKFGYRTSIIQQSHGIVISTKMKLKKGNKTEIKNLMDDLNKRRKDKQPLSLPSAGSIFKRPAGYYAGKLIEDSGLRGFRVGGAQVSEMHCGFIVNADNATAEEVINLISHVQRTVKDKFGVQLEREVRIIGES